MLTGISRSPFRRTATAVPPCLGGNDLPFIRRRTAAQSSLRSEFSSVIRSFRKSVGPNLLIADWNVMAIRIRKAAFAGMERQQP